MHLAKNHRVVEQIADPGERLRIDENPTGNGDFCLKGVRGLSVVLGGRSGVKFRLAGRQVHDVRLPALESSRCRRI
jgi:hypothetical protein